MQNVHFIGIAGSGASAVAAIAQAQGFKVSGCDNNPHNEFTTNFSDDQLFAGHDPSHLEGVDILAITPAITSYDPNNPELLTAKQQQIPTMTWQEFMGKYLEPNHKVIAVCGTKGKSSTTAMAGLLLEDAGLDPTVELGAKIGRWDVNFRIGKGEWFVTEADEFNDNFLVTHPDIAIVTNIEMDHPEFFADFDSYKQSFIKFLSQTKQLIIANMGDPNVGEVIKVVMKHSAVSVIDYSKSDFQLELKVIGEHMKLNANAVFQLGLSLGIETDQIRQSLTNYAGIGRRGELIGQINGAEIYSDYAHNPMSIEATAKAFANQFPDRDLWLIFEPHMFSRTKALFDEFARVLKAAPAKRVTVLDIYPAREADTGIVSSGELVSAINESKVEHQPDFNQLSKQLQKITNQDVVVFMGAGPIDKWAREQVNG